MAMPVPMILILGCTASGKSNLAFKLAQLLNGDILSIDSMKVYRRMDIGTAKPSIQARNRITHHLIDVIEPWESFSLGRFVELADQAIETIQNAGRPIIAVGGTAMYIRGLIEGVFEGPAASDAIRAKLKAQAKENGLEYLFNHLSLVDPPTASKVHPNDLKRIVRALEVYELTGKPISSYQTQFGSRQYRHPWQLIGIRRDKENNNHRINQRVKTMIEQGLVDEVQTLLSDPHGLSQQASQAVGYAEIINHFNGRLSLEEAIEQIKINTRRLAKRQRTWFRGFSDVTWFVADSKTTTETLVDDIVNHIKTTARKS